MKVTSSRPLSYIDEETALAYNYLELVNDVNRRLNEVPLTSSNFASAVGFYADVKGYVNSALNRINREEFEWPFNHTTYTQTLTVNQSKYSYRPDAKSVAFDTFRLKGSDALNVTSKKLRVMDYEEYLNTYSDYEFNPADYADSTQYVIRNRDLSFTLAPPPDQAYEVVYEYYRLPVDLSNWDDVPTVPEQFRWVILEGAMYHAYMFRGAIEEASVSNQLFQSGLKDMRKLYINRTEYARSTVIRS
jgi:hypothetical protein